MMYRAGAVSCIVVGMSHKSPDLICTALVSLTPGGALRLDFEAGAGLADDRRRDWLAQGSQAALGQLAISLALLPDAQIPATLFLGSSVFGTMMQRGLTPPEPFIHSAVYRRGGLLRVLWISETIHGLRHGLQEAQALSSRDQQGDRSGLRDGDGWFYHRTDLDGGVNKAIPRRYVVPQGT